MADEPTKTVEFDETPEASPDRSPLEQAFVQPDDNSDDDVPELEPESDDAREELPVTREQFTQLLDVLREQQKEIAAFKTPQKPQEPGLSLKERLIKNRDLPEDTADIIAEAFEEVMGDMDGRYLPKQYEGALAQSFLHLRQQQAADKLRKRYNPDDADLSDIDVGAQKVQEEFGNAVPAELAMEVALLRKQASRKRPPAKPAMQKPFAPTHTGAHAKRVARISDEEFEQMTDQEIALAFLEGRN